MNAIVFQVVGLIDNPEEQFRTLYEEQALAFAQAVEQSITVPPNYILHWVGYVSDDLPPRHLSICVDIYHQGRFRIPTEVGTTAYRARIEDGKICLEDECLAFPRSFGEVVSAVVARIEAIVHRHSHSPST